MIATYVCLVCVAAIFSLSFFRKHFRFYGFQLDEFVDKFAFIFPFSANVHAHMNEKLEFPQ